jgi:transketolase
MRNVFASNLLEKAKSDSRIILIVGDLGYGVFDEFESQLPKQYLNLGVTEQASMSFVAGLASEGFRPFYYSIANFPTFRCLEQIRNDIAYMKNPVTIVSVGAGYAYSSHGYTHHAVEDLAIMRSIFPDTIYSPYSTITVTKSLNEILESNKPAYLRLGVDDDTLIDSVNNQHDIDVLIIYTGSLNSRVQKLIRMLSEISLNVDFMPIYHLNKDKFIENMNRIESAKLVVSIEEHSLIGGLGSFILEFLSDQSKNVRILRFGLNSEPLHVSAPRDILLDQSGLDCEEMFTRIKNFLQLIN